jgi:hypothetical protein
MWKIPLNWELLGKKLDKFPSSPVPSLSAGIVTVNFTVVVLNLKNSRSQAVSA